MEKFDRRAAFYADVFAWLHAQVAALRAPGRAVVLGVNGPQGAGKSTLVRELEIRFAAVGLHAVGLSVDDFYLTRAEQVALAAEALRRRPPVPTGQHRVVVLGADRLPV